MEKPTEIIAIAIAAGSWKAARRFLDALPDPAGFAYILILHPASERDGDLVERLAPLTSLVVLDAQDHLAITPDHLYVVLRGKSATVRGGLLRLPPQSAADGLTGPVDVLLQALAEDSGPRAMAVILSGDGSDGSAGALAVKEAGGLVLVQTLAEAESDRMPRGVIARGAASRVMPVAEMPAALLHHARDDLGILDDGLQRIVALLNDRTGNDFSLYKPGMLRQRIGADGPAAFLSKLESDPQETAQLARRLLVSATSFFRDAHVFDVLATEVLPRLIAAHPAGQPLRIWVAGCGTGEEAWSLAMTFREAIMASGREIRLQVFASGLDPDAVTFARRAVYPATISSDVSVKRLARFFAAEDAGWRIRQELRDCVVFAVQDILSDPPFTRLDFVCCRDLLAQLKPEAQARLIRMIQIALRPGGLMLLGGSETPGRAEAEFEPVSSRGRLWRRVGQSLPAEARMPVRDRAALPSSPRETIVTPRQPSLAEICRQLVLESHAPAALLIDRNNICLYSMGATDRYLEYSAGRHAHDLFAMARPGLRPRLRTAVQRARVTEGPVSEHRIRMPGASSSAGLRIDARTVIVQGETLVFLCFVEEPWLEAAPEGTHGASSDSGEAALHRELEATRGELQSAILELDRAIEEQRLLTEEFQSTQEELLLSREKLQALNEERNLLNARLQATLDRSRVIANDLHNVLISSNAAKLFLDMDLRIRFFTPAARAVLNTLESDIGRPLADLRVIVPDAALLEDAEAVLQSGGERASKIQTPRGDWLSRRVLPYRSLEGQIEGVVVTFEDVTERAEASVALEEARQTREVANATRSRFLATAAHDLRQPLQMLTHIKDMLTPVVQGQEAERLVRLLEPAIGAMSGILNTLLDLNQIGGGAPKPVLVAFPLNRLLNQLRDEFSFLAAARGLELRVVPCGLTILTDPILLEHILRNLLGNALRYTNEGRVLLGCRRHATSVSICIHDTGIGIAEQDLQTIFHARDQDRDLVADIAGGAGLGLAVVQPLADLLEHRLSVRSTLGLGSVFTVEAALASGPASRDSKPVSMPMRTGRILVIEDEPATRDMLVQTLSAAGHRVMAARDATRALAILAEGAIRPELVIAGYRLPGGMTGVELAGTLRALLPGALPIILLTDEDAPDPSRSMQLINCVQMQRPVQTHELSRIIQYLLPDAVPVPQNSLPSAAGAPQVQTLFIVDDDAAARTSLRSVLEKQGYLVQEYESAEAFLVAYQKAGDACLLLELHLPGMSGLELLAALRASGDAIPAIMITAFSDVPAAVLAMRSGAADFMPKPVRSQALLAVLARVLERSRDTEKHAAVRLDAAHRIATLTPRRRMILERVLAGAPSKNIAADIGISRRTVEAHRAAIMRHMGVRSLPALMRYVLSARSDDEDDSPQ